MMKVALRGLFFAALAAALYVRLTDLPLRPMHHDEANQAVKFGTLLEKGEYRYDKTDHHGPVLYYLTLPAALMKGQGTLASLDETTLRIAPALFGAGLIILLLLFGSSLVREARVIAALLIAASPAMTYYSRFYIQESIFVFFTLGFLASVWRYMRRPDGGWALPAGIFAGLMAATKETAVIIFAAVGLSLGFVLVRQRLISRRAEKPIRNRIFIRDVLLASVAAAGTAALLFSSFGKNPQGILDSLSALKLYFEKGISNPGLHAQSFLSYLSLLTYSKSGGVVWSEAIVLLLGFIGMTSIIFRRRSSKKYAEDLHPVDQSLGIFLLVYTIVTTLFFSFLSYKTPWNILPFYLGWLILAGIGGAAILRWAKPFTLKAALVLIFAASLYHLGWQNHRANFLYPADPRNPYVYAQTSPDFEKLIRRIEILAAGHPERKDLLIKVIADPYEQWPLPWSLRGFSRVGYWTEASAVPELAKADLIIVSSNQTEIVQKKLGSRFSFEYFGLRPEVLLTLFIPRKL